VDLPREVQAPAYAIFGKNKKGPESSAPCLSILTLRLLSRGSGYPAVTLWGIWTLPSRVRLSPPSALGIQLSKTTARHKHVLRPPDLAAMFVSGCHRGASCPAPHNSISHSWILGNGTRVPYAFHRESGHGRPAHSLCRAQGLLPTCDGQRDPGALRPEHQGAVPLRGLMSFRRREDGLVVRVMLEWRTRRWGDETA